MNKMKQVIRISEEPKEEKVLKPIELTHYQTPDGWVLEHDYKNIVHDKLVYLGCCKIDGDMFAAYKNTVIRIFKGHLNDGVY